MNKTIWENTIDLYPIPVSKQVIPRVYLGNPISRDKSLFIISKGKKLQRNNTPGLIYGKFQLPNHARGNNQMGWKTILSYPTSDINLHSLFKIVIRKEPQIKTSHIIGIIHFCPTMEFLCLSGTHRPIICTTIQI